MAKRVRKPTLPYAAGSSTSKAAAKSMVNKAEVQRERICNLLKKVRKPLTDQAIQLALDMAGDSERPRRGELEAAGRVVKIPGKTGLTLSGRAADLYRAV